MACEQCERLTAEINRAIDASEHGKCKDAIQDMLAILEDALTPEMTQRERTRLAGMRMREEIKRKVVGTTTYPTRQPTCLTASTPRQGNPRCAKAAPNELTAKCKPLRAALRGRSKHAAYLDDATFMGKTKNDG